MVFRLAQGYGVLCGVKVVPLVAGLWRRYSGTFVGNVVIVAGGTAVAQIIGIIFLPIITRLYGPEIFGILSVFISIVVIVSSIATLSYSYSIVLPKSDVVAYQLLKISILLACIISSAVGLLIMLFNVPIVALFNIEIIAPFLWLIPIAMFLTAIIHSLEQWKVRYIQYKSLSMAVIVQAGFLNGVRTGMGFFAPTSAALIVSGMVAQVLQIYVLYLTDQGSIRRIRRVSKSACRRQVAVLRVAARRYRDFPLYRAPQILLNTISRATPLLLLASLFDPAVAGFYAIAQSVLYLPVILISQSVGKVFLKKITTQVHNNEPLSPLILKSTFALVLLGVIPFGVIMLLGPWLFGFVFGADWMEAGNYARWLGVWVFFHFINVPAVQSLTVTNSQNVLLIWEILTTIIKVALLFLVGTITKNAELTVAVYAVFGAIAYIVLIVISIIQAKKNECVR